MVTKLKTIRQQQRAVVPLINELIKNALEIAEVWSCMRTSEKNPNGLHRKNYLLCTVVEVQDTSG
jgi:hypothetical protein